MSQNKVLSQNVEEAKDIVMNLHILAAFPASTITSHGFAVLFIFIITTAVVYVHKMRHPVPACRINEQAHPFLSQRQIHSALKSLVSAKVAETWFGRVIAP